MPENPIKSTIDVRYGREAGENARFARGLADLLRRVGFEVRLVEEPDASGPGRSPEGGGDSLFILTRAWLERSSSPEGRDRPAEDHRQLAVRREPIDDSLIEAHLRGLPTVEWLPDDPEPDARFWEVYCGLTRTAPGDREGRAARGRDLLEPPRPILGPDSTDHVPCPGRPSLARPSEAGTLLLTDSGACFRVDHQGPTRLEALPDLEGCSGVAVDATGRHFVGLYDGMVATLLGDEWSYQPAEAPVLSLAATPGGLAVGDSAGSVTFGPSAGSASLGEPVVDLVPFDGGVVALGARGGLWRVETLEGGRASASVMATNEALGRPVGLFDAGDRTKVGAFSAGRVALLIRGARALRVGVRRFPEGIGSVVPFGPAGDDTDGPPLGLLTDAGQVWTVSGDLNLVAPIPLPDASGEVVGLAPGVGGGLLAWTSGGTAFAIARDRSARSLAVGDVALAFADPVHVGCVSLVHWHPDRGLQVRRLRPDPSR